MRTIALLLALAPVLPAQSSWYVDLNATAPDDKSPGSPYTSIPYAIAQSSTLAGDTPSIAPNVLPGEWGILAWAGQVGSQPFFGGTLCLQAPIVRTAPGLPTGTGPGSGELSFQFSQAYMSSQLLLAYDTLFARWWTRDPGSSIPVGLTDALAVEVLP